jgi:hypothetical protein
LEAGTTPILFMTMFQTKKQPSEAITAKNIRQNATSGFNNVSNGVFFGKNKK